MKNSLPLLFFHLLIVLSVCGQELYELDPKYPVHELGDYLKVYPDTNEEVTATDILTNTSGTFIPGNELPRYFMGQERLWGELNFIAVDSLQGWTLHFKDIFIGGPAWVKGNGKVDVYAFADEQLLFHKKTGPGYSRSDRDIKENWVLNRIRLDPVPVGTPVTLVFRVSGNNFGYPPFFNLNFRGPSQAYYHEINEFNNGFYIFMLGVTFIILLYHLLQYLYVKDTIFLYFSLWVFFCFMTLLMSVGGVLDHIYEYSFIFWFFFSQGVYFVFWFFGRSFIQSKEKFPRLDKWILALASLMILYMVIVIATVVFTSIQPRMIAVGASNHIMVFINFLGLVLSIIIASRKDNFARYFGMGAIIGLVLLIIGSAWSAGWINFPGFEPHSWAMFAQIIIFSFGIAYRRQVIMKANNEAKLEAQWNIAEMNRMKDLDDIKTRFFANISHEFRTPLTLISGPLERAKKSSETGSGDSILLPNKVYSLIKKNTNRLQILIDQLLDIAKIESGAIHLNLTQGRLIQFIKSIVFSFESVAEEQSISLNSNFAEELENAYYDKDKLEKILNNLLSNAFKYTPQGGAVNVAVSHTEECVSIEISDTGAGMCKEEVDRIFDRFYRVEGSEAKGSGIGLALTKELIDLQNGIISVHSRKGRGTSIKVRLPITPNGFPESVLLQNNKRDASPIKSAQTIVPLSENGAMHTPVDNHENLVLIVEDNTSLQDFIFEILKDQYTLITADDGLQGERMAFEHIPDLVISDVMMPKKDGYELCNSLKNNVKTSHIPIIMLTAKAGKSNKLAGLMQGADAYLTKPFDAEELLVRIKNLIQARKKIWEQFKSLDLPLISDLELKSVDDVFVQKVVKTIKENLDNELLSVEDIASRVGFSRAQLHRKLKALLNKSAGQLVSEIRLNEARKMLENKVGSVSEIAYSVGYSNMSYFTKSFKEKFGLLPSKV